MPHIFCRYCQVTSNLLQPTLKHVCGQHEGEPPHFNFILAGLLGNNSQSDGIGRVCPHIGRHMPSLSQICPLTRNPFEDIVYEKPVRSDEELVARISVAAGAVPEMPGVFEKSPPPFASIIAGVTPLPQFLL
ncbi:hypothetical protein AVEN_185371-1 [Araneus ventricosus]|uniref:Uncharacterized protein n=1 Tax=Araneus ventricosus TaxID=182803 RepID=A0A4Y2J7I9_ARAVE|nr:hypothetical protein AVEN_185371-1 [Araneus ventricosus]